MKRVFALLVGVLLLAGCNSEKGGANDNGVHRESSTNSSGGMTGGSPAGGSLGGGGGSSGTIGTGVGAHGSVGP
jgi:hypothetical protein